MIMPHINIHLPNDVESSILAAVHSGQFASLDDAMTEAARLLLQRLKQQPQPGAAMPTAGEQSSRKRIWEVAEDIRRSVPAEEWAKLPADGAEQHDHYIYGTPKRSPAQ